MQNMGVDILSFRTQRFPTSCATDLWTIIASASTGFPFKWKVIYCKGVGGGKLGARNQTPDLFHVTLLVSGIFITARRQR